MPFTLVKGGSDDPSANSYADRADYLAFWGDTGIDGTDLTAVATADVERHLINATRFVEQLEWRGYPKYAHLQDNLLRLGFPRRGFSVGSGNPYLPEGHPIDEDTVPVVVIRAVCILAEEERFRGVALDRPQKDRKEILKRKKSILASEKEWADPLAARRYPAAMSLLAGLYTPTPSTVRLIAV